MHPPAIFKHAFDVYNFSTILNFFHRYKSSARIIKNVRTKCIIFGEALRIKVKKFKQNLPENYSKSTNIAITASKFSKNFLGSMPTDPLEHFLFLNQLQIISAEKTEGKNVEITLTLPPPPFEISRYTTADHDCYRSKSGRWFWAPPHFRNASAIAAVDPTGLLYCTAFKRLNSLVLTIK